MRVCIGKRVCKEGLESDKAALLGVGERERGREKGGVLTPFPAQEEKKEIEKAIMWPPL